MLKFNGLRYFFLFTCCSLPSIYTLKKRKPQKSLLRLLVPMASLQCDQNLVFQSGGNVAVGSGYGNVNVHTEFVT